MLTHALAHLSDAALLRELARLVAQDRLTTAALLGHLAEVDARRLYLPAGYPSMHAYCVEGLHLSEDAAFRRIRAARAARQFPVLYAALSEGRLHLAAISLLAPHLTGENVDELVEAASYRRKAEIEELLAQRFPVPEAMPVLHSCRAIAAGSVAQLVPGRVDHEASEGSETRNDELVPGRVGEERAEERAEAAPSPERFLLHITLAKSTHAKLRYAQALLSHAVPDGDLARVLDRALDALIPQLEGRKFGARARGAGKRGPRPQVAERSTPRLPEAPPAPGAAPQGASGRRRYVPAHVRRAVWERDQGQCTFVGASGRRCAERRFLEYDHVDPVALGGVPSAERMRLRCRAHNQYEAERIFGARFMAHKRREAQLASASKAEAASKAASTAHFEDILAGLRALGCRGTEARRAAEYSETLRGATLEARMRAALEFLGSHRAAARARCDKAGGEPVRNT